MTDLLSGFSGLWIADNRPLSPPGCLIGPDGWRIVVEAFYTPTNTRRFGSDTFGSDLFGDYANSPGGAPEWVDWTRFVSSLNVVRGLREANVNAATDVIDFAVFDPDGAILQWEPPGSLASPQINVPVRIRFLTPDLVSSTLVTARINRIAQTHGGTEGEIDFTCLGTKTDLRTKVLPQIFPIQTIAARIDQVMAEIGFQDPLEPYPASFFTTDLARDPSERTGDRLDVYEIVEEATMSAGYTTWTTRDGGLTWIFIGGAPVTPSVALFSDCQGDDVDVDAVTVNQTWGSGTDAILNVVQVEAADPSFSAEAIDATSVTRFGRRSTGYGAPFKVANKDKADAQAIADGILPTTAFRVDRVAQIEFHTLADPRWWTAVNDLVLFDTVTIRRTVPQLTDFLSGLIGIELQVSPEHIEGILYLTARQQTL